MPADVFQVTIDGDDDGFGHLHVVVVDIDSGQRLLIPAYDATKKKVTDLCNALHAQGVYQGIGWVEINNAKEVAFDDPSKWTGKPARWVPYKLRRIEKRRLRRRVGELSDKALGQIVECLLKLHAQRPGSTLTEQELKRVKQLASQLSFKIPKGI